MSSPSFLFISKHGESFPLVYRLQKQNITSSIYVHNPTYHKLYSGIIPRIRLSNLLKSVASATHIIFDNSCYTTSSAHDASLLKLFQCPADSLDIFGTVADVIKQQYPDKTVIGASSSLFMLSLLQQQQLAQQLNLYIPQTQHFTDTTSASSYIDQQQKSSSSNRIPLFSFIPDTAQPYNIPYHEHYAGELSYNLRNRFHVLYPNISSFYIQQQPQGQPLYISAWFDGNSYTFYSYTIIDHHINNGNTGIYTGSQGVVFWMSKDSILSSTFSKLIPFLKQTSYKGMVTIHCIFDSYKHHPYFIRFIFHHLWDAFYCLSYAMNDELQKLFTADASISASASPSSSSSLIICTQRISCPPYPLLVSSLQPLIHNIEVDGKLKHIYLQDIYFNNGFKCAGTDGLIGVAAGKGKTIGTAANDLYQHINSLRISAPIQYRTDAGRHAEKVIRKLSKWGYNIAI